MVLGLVGYQLMNGKKSKTAFIQEPMASSTATTVIYNNTDYGFNFTLLESWKGYSIVKTNWQGSPLAATSTEQTGTKLLIRNPKWTEALPYQDIPVLVFTVAQWNLYAAENFTVSAAPIPATELGRNNMYVFALPPRWNFDYSEGFVEAEKIVNSNPLKAYNIQTNISGKLNINVICDGALSYMTFTDSVSASKFVAECKEGKHPEVIERYKADMHIPDGAVI
jgi:hypothetical protein